jgi:CcmD family protein
MDFDGGLDRYVKDQDENFIRTKIIAMKKLISILTFISLVFFANAQDVNMADIMKENGKIYVVIAVMLTILAGLVLYLVRLDRKISKLEKNK